MTIPVNIDLSIVQSPTHPERGISAYARDFALVFDRVHDPARIDPLWVLADELPIPPSLAPLAAAGRLARFSEARRHRPPRLSHFVSPFYGPTSPLPVRRWLDANPAPFVMTLHDLIPLLMPDAYLPRFDHRAQFFAQLEWLRQADGLLANSEYSRSDAIARLGIPARRVITVGTGISDRFTPAADPAEAERAAIAAVPGLRPGFVMYTGGSDERKNVEGLIRAFALVDPALRAAHQLAIVFRIHDAQRQELERLARELGIERDLLLTGFVDDEALLAMYRSTELFVFPSRYEGFGMPVAEALAAGAVTIAADNTSLPEVLPLAEARFDAEDPRAIAGAIERALTDAALRERIRSAAARIEHSWVRVAERTAAAYEAFAIGPGTRPPRVSGAAA